MNVDDYYQDGKRWWIRLHEKGGKFHQVPAHHTSEEYLDAYLAAAGIAANKKVPLFRTVDRRRQLTDQDGHFELLPNLIDLLALITDQGLRRPLAQSATG